MFELIMMLKFLLDEVYDGVILLVGFMFYLVEKLFKVRYVQFMFVGVDRWIINDFYKNFNVIFCIVNGIYVYVFG